MKKRKIVSRPVKFNQPYVRKRTKNSGSLLLKNSFEEEEDEVEWELIFLDIYRVGQKLLHIGLPQWASSHRTVFYSDFSKKLFNMKIFSIKFVIKKVILIFGVRWPLLLKTSHVPQSFFGHLC